MSARRPNQDSSVGLDRRQFLAASSSGLLAAAIPGGSHLADLASPFSPESSSTSSPQVSAGAKKKIPIGVFDPVYADLSLDAMIDKISALGLEAVEIGTGGYPGSNHCPVEELVTDPSKAKAWVKKFESRGIQVATLSCHGNPVHPDATHAKRDIQSFQNTVKLAQIIGVKVIVGFSGCPGGSPTDTQPNWIVYRWPEEYDQALQWQWKEKVIPYWKEAAKFARDHGIHRLAFEMHPNFVVYNPRTLLKLREAVGEEIGANCDLSHLFWQGCDAVEAIRVLGGQRAIFHAHMKDTLIVENLAAETGLLNFSENPAISTRGSVYFRAVGYGHGAQLWKEVVQAYMDIDYQGIFSIENEDPILTGVTGVERALYVLKNVRAELLQYATA